MIVHTIPPPTLNRGGMHLPIPPPPPPPPAIYAPVDSTICQHCTRVCQSSRFFPRANVWFLHALCMHAKPLNGGEIAVCLTQS